jgi:hypothetical protein
MTFNTSATFQSLIDSVFKNCIRTCGSVNFDFVNTFVDLLNNSIIIVYYSKNAVDSTGWFTRWVRYASLH